MSRRSSSVATPADTRRSVACPEAPVGRSRRGRRRSAARDARSGSPSPRRYLRPCRETFFLGFGYAEVGKDPSLSLLPRRRTVHAQIQSTLPSYFPRGRQCKYDSCVPSPAGPAKRIAHPNPSFSKLLISHPLPCQSVRLESRTLRESPPISKNKE